MKILFIGGHRNPGGPNEVNRNLIRFLPKKVLYQKSNNRYIVRIETILKIIFCDTIVFSGMMFKPYELSLAKFLKKKIIYIMHGCSKFEIGESSESEKNIFTKADRILCVSETYSKLIKTEFPEISDRIGIQMNGINWDEINRFRLKIEQTSINKSPNRIILFGGGRIEKKNIYVCQAVQQINECYPFKLHIDIYGYYRDNDDSKKISEIPCVTFHSVIPHNEVNIELAKSRLFIQNSQYESFSLALIDAIGLGCDVLFSKNVGAQDILVGKNEHDIIYDITDVNEIKNKILWVLEHPNNKRLYDSIDKDKTSLQFASNNLINTCYDEK